MALPRAAAAVPRRIAGHARRRLHAADSRNATGAGARPIAAHIKDESLNPTNSFKARGQSTAVTRARALGATTLSVPSAGNAGCAMAAYAARAGLDARVFLPRDVKRPFVDECALYGATTALVDGLITDAGRLAAETGRPLGWYDVSTLKEPYRLEGKKTMGFELAEQLGWRWPDWIVYPTGGGTGLIGMWKAFDELEAIGWMAPGRRPRMVSVQADGCAPIVRAFAAGRDCAEPVVGAHTIADGLRVPAAVGDFLMLRILRESGGTALSIADAAMVDGMRRLGSSEGISAAPEGGAALAALDRLLAAGKISARRRGRPLQYRWRAEISGRPGVIGTGNPQSTIGISLRTTRRLRGPSPRRRSQWWARSSSFRRCPRAAPT